MNCFEQLPKTEMTQGVFVQKIQKHILVSTDFLADYFFVTPNNRKCWKLSNTLYLVKACKNTECFYIFFDLSEQKEIKTFELQTKESDIYVVYTHSFFTETSQICRAIAYSRERGIIDFISLDYIQKSATNVSRVKKWSVLSWSDFSELYNKETGKTFLFQKISVDIPQTGDISLDNLIKSFLSVTPRISPEIVPFSDV